ARTDSDVTGNLSVEAEFAPEGAGPIANFAVNSYLSRSAVFSWTAAQEAGAVRIEQALQSGDDWSVSNTGTIATNAAVATVSSLEPGVDYKFRLVVEGGLNAGSSNVVTFTTMKTSTF